jgi:hypothetical protein
VGFGTWAFVADDQSWVFVYRVDFKPPSISFKKDLRLLVRLKAADGPARCGAGQVECVSNSHCAASGRCVCDSGFTPSYASKQFTPVDGKKQCGQFKPADMTCVDVGGAVQTIETTLTIANMDYSKFTDTMKDTLSKDIVSAFTTNLGSFRKGSDVSVTFSSGSIKAHVTIVPEAGQDIAVKAVLRANMANVMSAVTTTAKGTGMAGLLAFNKTAEDVSVAHTDLAEGGAVKCAAGNYCPGGSMFPCPLGSYCPEGSKSPVLCPEGKMGLTEKASSKSDCSDCPVGKFAALPGRTECTSCSAGTYTDQAASTACELCEVGKMGVKVQSSSKADCTDCPVGKLAALNGSTECTSCNVGTYTDQAASTACELCEVGKYNQEEGKNTCKSCGKSTLTTMYKTTVEGSLQWVLLEGAKSEASCGCKPGSRNVTGTGSNAECTTCGEGLSCAGMGDVEIVKGYYTLKSKPFTVYLCDPPELCLGNRSENCIGARTGFLCTKCDGNNIPEEVDEETDPNDLSAGCTPCRVDRALYLVIAFLAAFCLLCWELKEAKHSPLEESPTFIEIKNIGGQVLMFMQILGAIKSDRIDFGVPMDDFLAFVTEPISLNFIFAAIPCIASGFTDPVAVFAGKLLVPVVFLVVITIIFFIINCIKPRFLMRDGLMNVFGETLIEFYVSLTLGVLSPFRCYKHPAEGERSMYDSPEILCFDGGSHASMIGLSVMGLFMYTISTLVVTYAAVWYHPKAMAKGDIGLLVRCHFLFNRWDAKSYWFAVINVTRNALVAIWPMMIIDFGVACSFMMVTLLGPFLVSAYVMPRRTPAMNALDVLMQTVQMIIIVCGPMILLSEGGKSDFLSWMIMLLVLSVGITAALLVSIKGLQWLSRNRTPLSWAFDVYLDHHAGPGGCSARALKLILASHCRKGKVFYDVDSYQRNQNIGVIMDAAKLSKHLCVCLGSETWSRHWCFAAICSAIQWKAELSVVNFADAAAVGEAGLRSIVAPDTGIDQICAVLAKKAPRWMLRPYGMQDSGIPVAIKLVFQCKPIDFVMTTKSSTEGATKRILGAMTAVVLAEGVSRDSPQVSTKFFSSDPSAMKSAVCLSCDHGDTEAVNVSRLIGYLMSVSMAEACSKGAAIEGRYGAAVREQVQNLSLVQDIDTDSTVFASMVKGGKIPAVVVIVTGGTYTSAPQLLRLGFLQQYNTAGFRPHTLAICDIFSMPDTKVVQDIQKGKLALGSNPEAAIKAYLTEDVSFARVSLALIQVLESRVYMCNCPITTEATIKESLTRQLFKVAQSISIAAKPVPEEAQADKQDGNVMDVRHELSPAQRSPYMANYFAAEDGKVRIEEMIV